MNSVFRLIISFQSILIFKSSALYYFILRFTMKTIIKPKIKLTTMQTFLLFPIIIMLYCYTPRWNIP